MASPLRHMRPVVVIGWAVSASHCLPGPRFAGLVLPEEHGDDKHGGQRPKILFQDKPLGVFVVVSAMMLSPCMHHDEVIRGTPLNGSLLQCPRPPGNEHTPLITSLALVKQDGATQPGGVSRQQNPAEDLSV